MNIYFQNLKKNYFYTLMVGMIISLPLFMLFDNLTDETICTEPDYSGDVNECLRITANAKEIGWVLFTFPVGMALISGLFHFFPGGKEYFLAGELLKQPKKPEVEVKNQVSFGFIMAFIMSAISVLFITIAGGVINDDQQDVYFKVAVIIPIAIFIFGYRNFNGRWFWQEEKKEN